MPAEGSAGQESAEELTQPMLGLDLWVSVATATAAVAEDPMAFTTHLPPHLRWMIGLEEEGVLFASGPLLEDDGTAQGDGMTILRAASREEAETIAAADPLVRAGLRTVVVRRWRIMEGGISVSLSFAHGRYELS